MSEGVSGRQKTTSDAMGLALQVVVNHLLWELDPKWNAWISSLHS